jgi:hypothetical protein
MWHKKGQKKRLRKQEVRRKLIRFNQLWKLKLKQMHQKVKPFWSGRYEITLAPKSFLNHYPQNKAALEEILQFVNTTRYIRHKRDFARYKDSVQPKNITPFVYNSLSARAKARIAVYSHGYYCYLLQFAVEPVMRKEMLSIVRSRISPYDSELQKLDDFLWRQGNVRLLEKKKNPHKTRYNRAKEKRQWKNKVSDLEP